MQRNLNASAGKFSVLLTNLDHMHSNSFWPPHEAVLLLQNLAQLLKHRHHCCLPSAQVILHVDVSKRAEGCWYPGSHWGGCLLRRSRRPQMGQHIRAGIALIVHISFTCIKALSHLITLNICTQALFKRGQCNTKRFVHTSCCQLQRA